MNEGGLDNKKNEMSALLGHWSLGLNINISIKGRQMRERTTFGVQYGLFMTRIMFTIHNNITEEFEQIRGNF